MCNYRQEAISSRTYLFRQAEKKRPFLMTYFFLARPHAVFPLLEEEEKKNKAGEGDGQEQTSFRHTGRVRGFPKPLI